MGRRPEDMLLAEVRALRTEVEKLKRHQHPDLLGHLPPQWVVFTLGPDALDPSVSAPFWLSGTPRMTVLVRGTTTTDSEVDMLRNGTGLGPLTIPAGTDVRATLTPGQVFESGDILEMEAVTIGAGASAITAKAIW